MTLCAGCNYPIPSWQHNGACKPVAEKVPQIHHAVRDAALKASYLSAAASRLADSMDLSPCTFCGQSPCDQTFSHPHMPPVAKPLTENRTDVPEIPTDVPKKRGRPGKWSSETERKAAYRARKQG